LDIVLPGCSFDIHLKGPRYRGRTAKIRATIESTEPQPDKTSPFYFDYFETQKTIANEVLKKEASVKTDGILQINGNGIGGLSDHLRTINEHLCLLNDPHFTSLDTHFLGSMTFLVHGPEGCGKTLLLSRFAECPWRKVFNIDEDWLATNRKGLSEALSNVFAVARTQQPALILMDELDKFVQKAESLLGSLQVELEKLEGTRVVVAATARKILDIDARLRTPSGFMTELEIFPPDLKQREDVLQQTIGMDQRQLNIDIVALAERSHGFVGRDICKLWKLARRHRVVQARKTLTAEKESSLPRILSDMAFVEQQDLDAVFDQVQPSVLKGSIIEVPKVRWADIAGVDHVRAELEAIVVRPYKVRSLPANGTPP
jgi:AAA family ATPase